MIAKFRHYGLIAIALVCAAVVVSACGGSSGGSSSNGGGGSSTPSTVGGIAQTGAGLTEPTSPRGTKVSGGTVYFSEAAGSPPNYIFPMYSAQYCGINNIDQLNLILYRPLYWYGNSYSPTIDYNYSVGEAPAFTDGDKTVTVHIKPYKWSNGETVTSRDVIFWMNLLKADPAKEWCGYVPGNFPDNVVSYSAPNSSTVVFHLNKAYNPTWFTYNELSQIYPMPIAWDRTSLSGKTPTASSTDLPDTTKSGAAAVYSFLNAQGAKLNTWANSPLWSVVDGPFKVSAVTNDGEVTMTPNPDYSGSPKASISKFVEVPFTTNQALFNEIKSGGPSALTVSALPPEDVPQASSVVSEGYTDNKAASYSVNFFPLNFNNPTVGPVFRQLYFRQAFQHLVDQDGWISAFLNHTAVPTYGPVPTAPPSPLVSSSGTGVTGDLYPFSVAAASKLLTANGWKVVPGGASSCEKPGAGTGHCGAGTTSGETISFNLDYISGIPSTAQEMQDLQAEAKKVGISISLSTHPFDDVYSAAVHCTSTQPTCKWTAENWGAGWIYGPDYFPSGEDLFQTGSVANYSNYTDATMDALIKKTTTGPESQERTAMANFVGYTEKQLPVVFGPTSIGTFGSSGGNLISDKLGGYEANALGWATPEQWYLVK